jgi:membrane-bound inhibitor of C-type lysozyme
MRTTAIAFWCLTATLVAFPALAAGSSVQILLDLTGNAERTIVSYNCETMEERLDVEYVNAHPNFIAILRVEGETRIFVTTISGSGARYVSGEYVWWTSGPDATLSSQMSAEDASPLLSCFEASEIP